MFARELTESLREDFMGEPEVKSYTQLSFSIGGPLEFFSEGIECQSKNAEMQDVARNTCRNCLR